MTALKIIGIILLVFLLIGFLRIGAIVSFGDELRVRLRVGAIKLTVLPKKEKKPKKPKKEKKPKAEEPEEKKEEKPKKKRAIPKPTLEDILDLLETALSALGAMVRRACRRTRIDPLDLTLVFGGRDPADVAMSFGMANAAVFALMPKAEEKFYIPNPSLRLRMNYDAEGTEAFGSVGLSLRVCDLFAIVFALVVPMAKWFLRFKKAQKHDQLAHKGPEQKVQNDTEDKIA
ncbi:MAG: DUF2953 domain-containing protein [Oscillospiraceae bacterium]|nr:DUF2953 domain-containing protein [Oscillospiraceae bacterium]